MALTLALGTVAGTNFYGIDNGQQLIYVFGTIVASGSYATGGDTLSFANQDILKSQYVPLQVSMWSQKAGGGSGYLYSWSPGTTLANGKMQIWVSAAAGSPHSELAAGAYAAGITGDNIVFSAVFVRL